MTKNISKIENSRLLAIKRQAIYNRSVDAKLRITISMNHIEGLRQLKKNAKRVKNEKIR